MWSQTSRNTRRIVNYIRFYCSCFMNFLLVLVFILFNFIICFGFKKTNREISTIRGEIMNLFFQEFILQTKFRSKTLSVSLSESIKINLNCCKHCYWIHMTMFAAKTSAFKTKTCVCNTQRLYCNLICTVIW